MVNRQLAINKKSPILVTGCARSGTSIVGGIINICGAFGGSMSGSNRYNMKGMFENSFIRDRMTKPFLHETLHVDRLGQNPLPVTSEMIIPTNWKQRVHAVFLRDGYKSGSWFYKDAISCLIWPVWHYAFPRSKWIIVRRNSADIAESCMNTGFMSKRPDFDGWIDWVHEHEEKWREMHVAEMDIREVWPERMVNGDYSRMKEAIEWLGLTWKEAEVAEFVEPKLWKSRGRRDKFKLEYNEDGTN